MPPQDWPLLPLEDPQGPTRMTVVLDCQWRWWACVCVCEYGSTWPEDHTTPHHTMVKWVRTCLQGLSSVSNTVLSLILSGYYLSKCCSESLWAAACVLCAPDCFYGTLEVFICLSVPLSLICTFLIERTLKQKQEMFFVFVFLLSLQTGLRSRNNGWVSDFLS